MDRPVRFSNSLQLLAVAFTVFVVVVGIVKVRRHQAPELSQSATAKHVYASARRIDEGYPDDLLEPRRMTFGDQLGNAAGEIAATTYNDPVWQRRAAPAHRPVAEHQPLARLQRLPPVAENLPLSPPANEMGPQPSAHRLKRLPAVVAESIRSAASPDAQCGPYRETAQQPDDDSDLPAVTPHLVLRRRPDFEPGMQTVSQQAQQRVQYGFSLAQRGAYFSARAEFIEALEIIAQALDVFEGAPAHSRRLAEGLTALTEADDFAASGSRGGVDLDVAFITQSHETAVVAKGEDVSALVASQRYYTFAQNALAEAFVQQPAASMALYGLGKIYLSQSALTPADKRSSDPKAMAMFHAALAADRRNYQAANELGVLLARYGRLHEARSVLLHGLSQNSQAAGWHNLAVVHQRLGEAALAERARYEWRQAGGRSETPGAPAIQWVAPDAFARTSPDGPLPKLAPMAPPATEPLPRPSNTAWRWPWQRATR